MRNQKLKSINFQEQESDMLQYENRLNNEREKFKKYSEENQIKNEEINNLKKILED